MSESVGVPSPLGDAIAREAKLFAQRKNVEYEGWPHDAPLWRISQDIRAEPLLRRDVQISAYHVFEKGESLFFIPSLQRLEGKDWNGISLHGESAISYPLRELYPASGTLEETCEKLKILIEYAWLRATLFKESDLEINNVR